VSLVPSLTEIVFALKRGDDLVGVSSYCDYPIEAKMKYQVGDFSNPSLERIVGLNPELILVSLPEQTRIKQSLEQLGLKTYNSSPESIEDILSDIRSLGVMLKVPGRADSLVDSLRHELAEMARHQRSSEVRVYIEISAQPLVSVGSRSYINEMIGRAGGRNIFEDIKAEYPVVSQEELINRNPEVIFVLHQAQIGKRVGWGKVKAVTDKRVYDDLDPDLIFRPGPRVVEGIKRMRTAMSNE
jgi:iron complex transport system substrate-binding protein